MPRHKENSVLMRATMLVAASILFLILGLIGRFIWKTKTYKACFDKTQIGDSYNKVITCFGRPDEIQMEWVNRGEYFTNAARMNRSVEKVISYPFFFDINIATVSFDKKDSVIAKAMYTSP
jgi:hypothetical protein